MLVWYIKETTK